MDRKVYELSGTLTEENKDQAVSLKLQNESDRIESPATLNVVRVRCPSQFEGVGTCVVGSGSTLVEPIVVRNDASNFDVKLYSDGTSINIKNNGSTTLTVDAPNLQTTVLPYHSPAEALINFEDAVDIAAKSLSEIHTDTISAGTHALQSYVEFLYYQAEAGDVKVTMYEHVGSNTHDDILYQETLSLRAGVTRFTPNIVNLPGFVRLPHRDLADEQTGLELQPVDSSGADDASRTTHHAALVFFKKSFDNNKIKYSTNTSLRLVDGVLNLEYESNIFVKFNELAQERLALPPIPSVKDTKHYLFKATRSPSFNDVRRIVMTLTPATERVVAIDAGYTHKLYDNASISFTIDDDPSNNSAYAMYSLASDFETNSLRLTSGSAQELEFQLRKCVYDRTTGILGQPVSLSLPYKNNFVEVKLVVDKLKRARV